MKSEIQISFAWWLKPYLYALAWCCVMSGREADPAKLAAKIKRAMRVTVK